MSCWLVTAVKERAFQIGNRTWIPFSRIHLVRVIPVESYDVVEVTLGNEPLAVSGKGQAVFVDAEMRELFFRGFTGRLIE